jgi:hypothetical protein
LIGWTSVPPDSMPSRAIGNLLSASLILTGGLVNFACYPRPHEYLSNPQISGVLLRDGVPVSGAEVLMAHTDGYDGNYCREARVVAITSQDGHFHVAADTHWRLFTSLLNPPKYIQAMTSVCFDAPEHLKLGVLLLANTDRNRAVTLSCDLMSPPRDFKQAVIQQKDTWGICVNGVQ